MRCDDFLARAAESADDGSPLPGDVAAHVLSCGACRATLEDARAGAAALRRDAAEGGPAGEIPAADADAAWEAALAERSGAAGAPPSHLRSLLRSAVRVAAAVLATVGVAALAGARVETSRDGASLVLPLPWSPDGGTAARHAGKGSTDVDPSARQTAAVAALRADVVARLDALAARLDASDAAQSERLAEALAAIDARGRGATQALLGELAVLRRDVAQLQWMEDAVAEAAAMPSLPDPR